MKTKIHPEYYEEAKVICACGSTWTTGSTLSEIRTDICSNCHPFYTGEQRIVDTAGQVERFMNRLKYFGDHQETQLTRQKEAQAKAQKAFLNQQIAALDLPDRIFQILTNANYITVGDLFNKMDQDEEALLDLSGIGPKSVELIKDKLETLRNTFEASQKN